jgi:EmrB/QacA subfamily drug resistance transporter
MLTVPGRAQRATDLPSPSRQTAELAGRTPAAPSAESKSLGLALIVISAAQLMIVLDSTIVNVALPTVQRSLQFSTADLNWLITAYAVTFGGLLVFGGRTGDLYGKRRMFIIGVATFAGASFLAGLANSEVWLISARGLQGIGAAIAAPTALSLISSNFREGEIRNRALGVYAAMSGGGGAAGLLLGGILTDLVSWRWIFFVNVPIAAVVLFLAPRVLDESDRASGRLDIPGALTATGGVLSVVFGLSNAATYGWVSPATLVPLAAASVLLAWFGLIETRTAAPLVPLRMFKDRVRGATYAMMLSQGVAAFSMFFFLTQFLQNILGWNPLQTGIGFVPITAGVVLSATLTSRLVGRIGIRPPLLVGPAAVVVGLALLSRLTVSSSYADILVALLILAPGLGMQFVTLTLTAVRVARADETGVASALLNTAQQLGGAIGLSVLATVAINATEGRLGLSAGGADGLLTTGAINAAATTYGYATAFQVASVIELVSLLISAVVFGVPRRWLTDRFLGFAPFLPTREHSPHTCSMLECAD